MSKVLSRLELERKMQTSRTDSTYGDVARETVLDRGWWTCRVGAMRVTYLDATADDTSFGRFLEAMREDIDGETQRRAVLYEVGSAAALPASRRAAVSALLSARRTRLPAITIGFSLAAPSSVVRGALTASFLVAPPGYPWRICSAARESIAWLAARVPGASADAWARAYAAVRDDYASRGRAG